MVVEWVQHEILEAPLAVYNFEVEDWHTYFVSDSGVLVHNKCGFGSTRDELLDNVQNNSLKNAIEELYRLGATVGDGGLADAVRHELLTGELVGGKSHLIKAAERITNLENIIKKHNLSPSDLNIANSLLNDLRDALGGR